MANFLQKVLQLCERHMIIIPVISGETKNSLLCFKYGPGGELLKNNIHQEWLQTNVINADGNIFPFHTGPMNMKSDFGGLKEEFQFIKRLSSGKLPFGISEVKLEEMTTNSHETVNLETKYFYPRYSTVLRTCFYAQPSASTQFYDFWQRQRKIWWRKFANSPGRFYLTDIQSREDGQVVEIKADFPWGTETVETIQNRGSLPFDEMESSEKLLFEAKDGRKNVLPHLVESKTTLEQAALAYLCDAYEEKMFMEMPREVLQFHRKLSPYKVSFAASASTASVGQELSDLALFLTQQLRRAGVIVLLLPDVVKRSMEYQFARNDEMGIPYTVVLNDTSLKNGIVGLRSRDTTLKEQIHVSSLKTHMKILLGISENLKSTEKHEVDKV